VLFDGINAPEVIVEFAFGSTSTADLAAAGTFIIGSSLIGGPDKLGSVSWVQVADDVLSLDITTGQDDDTTGARPGTARVVVENYSGAYDPTQAEIVDVPTGLFPSTSMFPDTTVFPDDLAFPDVLGAEQVDVGKPVRIRYRFGTTVYSRFSGQVDDITFDAGLEPTVTFDCVDGLDNLGRAQLAALAAPAFDGDRSDVRIGRILDLGGWPTSQRSLETGLLTLSATAYGDFALPLLQQVADSELGTVMVDPDGKFVFYNRLHIYTATRSTTVQATLSDVGTDVDMLSLAITKSRSKVYNEVHVTRDGGVEQVAVDAVSKGKYGPRSYPGQVGVLAPTDGDAFSLASWLVSRYAQPHAEIRQVTVDATVQNMWATLLNLRPLDRIRVVRDYGPSTIDMQLIVYGLQEQVTPLGWQYTFSTINVTDFTPFIIGTSLIGGPGKLA